MNNSQYNPAADCNCNLMSRVGGHLKTNSEDGMRVQPVDPALSPFGYKAF